MNDTTHNPLQRAVFLDRDGALNEEVGYITTPEQFQVYDFAPAAVRAINDAGYRAIVVTNQSGIARGLYSEAFLAQLHAKLQQELQAEGARLDAIYYCPHHPEIGLPPYRQECACRKPKPGMLWRAAEEFAVDLAASFVIGDRYNDVALAHSVGAKAVLLLTGHGQREYDTEREQWPRAPEHVARNLWEAVQWILNAS